MIAFPLAILCLAAGVYLLIKVNREYLGGIFKFFAWLIIILSLVAVGGAIHHGVHHHFRRMHHMHDMRGPWGMNNMPGGHCDMQAPMGGPMGNCSMNMGSASACPMGGCKMVGDSIVLDKAICEKMMGKEACDSICKLRGQCIMTKDECAKMCSAAGKTCCPMDKGQEMKSCCKK